VLPAPRGTEAANSNSWSCGGRAPVANKQHNPHVQSRRCICGRVCVLSAQALLPALSQQGVLRHVLRQKARVAPSINTKASAIGAWYIVRVRTGAGPAVPGSPQLQRPRWSCPPCGTRGCTSSLQREYRWNRESGQQKVTAGSGRTCWTLSYSLEPSRVGWTLALGSRAGRAALTQVAHFLGHVLAYCWNPQLHADSCTLTHKLALPCAVLVTGLQRPRSMFSASRASCRPGQIAAVVAATPVAAGA
jgi:hypothetical protein